MSEKWEAVKERDRVSKRITWGIRKLDGSPNGHLIARDLTETNARLVVKAHNNHEALMKLAKRISEAGVQPYNQVARIILADIDREEQ